jgi:hypothetical protein
MGCISITFLLFHYFATVLSIQMSFPVIHNATLHALNSNSSIVNGSCNECLCMMQLNTTMIYAFNCFRNNGTCELFSHAFEINSITIKNHSTSSIYFISLPFDNSTSATASSMSKLRFCQLHDCFHLSSSLFFSKTARFSLI